MSLRKLASLLVPLVAFFAAATAGLAAGSDTVALARGLATVDADQIRADVEFIGSDELEGRDTPSKGLRVAARYLRARLQRLGWQPGAEDGYFYEYPLAWNRLDEEASSLVVRGLGGERRLVFAEDYFLASNRSMEDAVTEGRVVFCGTASKEELEGVSLEGAWALCVDSDVSWRRRRRTCDGAGAVGILVVPPSADETPYAERFARVLEAVRSGRVGWPSSRRSSSDRRTSTLYLSDPGGAELASLAGLGGGLDTLEVGTSLELTVTETRTLMGDGGIVQLENVCGFWPGNDPGLRDEVILVSAHYDHVGTSSGEIYNGADDNGSGTCGLLALAEALAEYGPMRRSVLLVWVSGEEKGLLGSRAWALDPWLPEGTRPVANLNIDMIGRNDPDSLLITPTRELGEHYNGLTRLAEELAPLEGFPQLGSADDYWTRSDHAMFAKLGIPVAFLFSDVHEDYHQPTDTPDKIDSDKIARVVRLVLRMLDGLQEDELDL